MESSMKYITMLKDKVEKGWGYIPGFMDKTSNKYRDKKERP